MELNRDFLVHAAYDYLTATRPYSKEAGAKFNDHLKLLAALDGSPNKRKGRIVWASELQERDFNLTLRGPTRTA